VWLLGCVLCKTCKNCSHSTGCICLLQSPLIMLAVSSLPAESFLFFSFLREWITIALLISCGNSNSWATANNTPAETGFFNACHARVLLDFMNCHQVESLPIAYTEHRGWLDHWGNQTNCTGSKQSLPTLINKKEPLWNWYRSTPDCTTMITMGVAFSQVVWLMGCWLVSASLK